MYCLRYWARYVRKGEVKSGGIIVLCNSFLYTNNIQKHYSVSRCVIFIVIVIAPTKAFPFVLFLLAKLFYSIPYIIYISCHQDHDNKLRESNTRRLLQKLRVGYAGR